MTDVQVVRERETPGGWEMTLRVARGPSGDSLHTLALSFADYEHWTHGSVSPSVAGEAVARAALELLEGEELPEGLDAARLARRAPDWGDRVRRALARET
jgi:hypothetical protein